MNSHVQRDGAVWGEDFVLSDTSLIRPVAGEPGVELPEFSSLFDTRSILLAPGRLCSNVYRGALSHPGTATLVRK